MLKLKKLQILGFKSFCDRTDLRFQGDGIAAIVGPNGCGKSNISDAISWVLGEQSARLLRGVNMQDVIFAGTRERKPTGMAEVSLTLVDPEIYGDVAEPEIDIQDDLPDDDWDESAVRAAKAEDVERYSEEVRPGQSDDEIAESGYTSTEAGAPPFPLQQEGGPPHVVLKIRRRKFKRTFKAGEITITRRLFRSGESEYLLNGKLCRLRDIQDIFMGTGLGPESYAIIEQGRIGQILSSKPTDRRAIIEEAAGITKFKTRKRLAEARLEDAKQNLARINDIFDEVTRQMNSLKRQASKAERYAKLRDEMRAKLRVLLVSKFAQLDAEATLLDQQLTEIGEAMHAQAKPCSRWKASMASARSAAMPSSANRRRIASSSTRFRSRSIAPQLAAVPTRSAAPNSMRASAAAQAETANTEAQLCAPAAGAGSQSRHPRIGQRGCRPRSAGVAATTAGGFGSVRQRCWRSSASRSSVAMPFCIAVSATSAVRNRITQAEERIAALDREAQRLHDETAAADPAIGNFRWPARPTRFGI